MRSAVNVLYFVILQILWIFRSLYENLLNGRSSDSAERLKYGTEHTEQDSANKRRHLIHLFTTTPTGQNGRPICYMNVCEIITPDEEEMLRCACAKGFPTDTRNVAEDNEKQFPPTNRMSRASFTNAWMESFSLVV